MKNDDQVRQLLKDLSRALVEAIATSPNVGDAVRQIREEGYSLHLSLDCKHEGLERGSAEIPLADRRQAARDPAFRLDGQDVQFLKSIGIDPTRPGRRRRGS